MYIGTHSYGAAEQQAPTISNYILDLEPVLVSRPFPPIISIDRVTHPCKKSVTSTPQMSDTNEDIYIAHQREASGDLIITIGPQCAGKTTFLRQIDHDIVDICLDDQPDVYITVPTSLVLEPDPESELLQQSFHNQSLFHRIQNKVERRLILQRWNQDVSPSEFEKSIVQLYPEDPSLAKLLISAVEEFLLDDLPVIPKTNQLFILESLFEPHPQTGQSAIDRAQKLLQSAMSSSTTTVAWGNTNALPRDYVCALQAAKEFKRKVRFVVWGYDLPRVSLKELLLRNLRRFQKSGKFIPAFAIQSTLEKVEALTKLKPQEDELERNYLANQLVQEAMPGWYLDEDFFLHQRCEEEE